MHLLTTYRPQIDSAYHDWMWYQSKFSPLNGFERGEVKLSRWGNVAEIGQAIASVFAVVVSIAAWQVASDTRDRDAPDQLEISEPTLGLYNPVVKQWESYVRWSNDSPAIAIEDLQWRVSTEAGRHFSVRLHNAGGQPIYLNAMGLVSKKVGNDTYHANLATMEMMCGPEFDRLKQCPEALSAGQAIIVQFTLSVQFLRLLDENYRNQSINFYVEMGSRSQYFASQISLPFIAFA